MKLLVFSDIHNDWEKMKGLLAEEADYYVAAGDQITWGRGIDQCGAVLQARASKIYVLPGNHETENQVAGMCARFGLDDLHGRHIQIGKWHLAGLGYSNPTPFNTPGEYSEVEIAERLQRFADLSPLVLICHAPPYGTPLDAIRPGVHAGSTAVRDFIEARQPHYFLCGHIHEAEGAATTIGRTRAYNAGKKGHLLELD